MNGSVLNERLFLEAELPFFMLDTQEYPTTTQGKIRFFFYSFNGNNDV